MFHVWGQYPGRQVSIKDPSVCLGLAVCVESRRAGGGGTREREEGGGESHRLYSKTPLGGRRMGYEMGLD